MRKKKRKNKIKKIKKTLKKYLTRKEINGRMDKSSGKTGGKQN